MLRLPAALLAVIASVLFPAPARATVLVPADLVELSRDAAAIVHGTVTSVRPVWADGRRRIETVVTLDVAQSIKGGLTGTISFKVPGGELGRYRSVMVGAPSFREGDEVVVFLGSAPPALPYLLGMGQGVYRVRRDGPAGRALVVPPALVADPEQPVTVRRGDPTRRVVSIDEFTSRVREAMATGPGSRRRPRTGAAGERLR